MTSDSRPSRLRSVGRNGMDSDRESAGCIAPGFGESVRALRFPRLVSPTVLLSMCLAACGGSGGGGSSKPPGPGQYTIGGSLSGLAADATVALSLNGGAALALRQNGPFTFPTSLDAGASYAVTLAASPAGQTCSIDGGSGHASANVTSVQVRCTAVVAGPWTIAGTVSGMTPGGRIVIGNRALDRTELVGNGNFSFTVADGADYAVWVASSPAGQLCSLSPAQGVAHTDVTGLAITCRASSLSVLTGSGGGMGYSDGMGTNSRFNRPGGTAVDAAGNVYVADRDNHLVRKITPAGVVSTLAGSPGEGGFGGSVDGVGAEARFCHPTGVAVNSAGVVFVTDGCNSAIRKITPDGTVTTFAGVMKDVGSADGTGAAARFDTPTGIAVDRLDNLYVTDTLSSTVRKITPSGVVSTIAGSAGVFGHVDGAGSISQFSRPNGVTVDAAGNLFIADAMNRVIRKITPAGIVSTFAGTVGVVGNADGGLGIATFALAVDVIDDGGLSPLVGLAVDGNGQVYVSDYFNHEIRRVAPDGQVTTIVGQGGAAYRDGRGTSAYMQTPTGLSLDAAGNLYASEDYSWIVRKITPLLDTSTFAGRVRLAGHADGDKRVASFHDVRGIASDASGNVYVADSNNNNVRRVAPDGTTTTWAGTAGVTGTNDGHRTGALFYHPDAVGIDAGGNVYISDSQASQIRLIGTDGNVSSVTAPDFGGGYQDGPTRQARFKRPTAFAFGPNGEVYVADAGVDAVRKIWQGNVSTVAGLSCGYVDGPVAAAKFCAAEGLATDVDGNVYVSDTRNGLIRKISTDGVVSTVAGHLKATGQADGFGAEAGFEWPGAMAIDAKGNIYVADRCTIRRVTPAGGVSTVAGRPGQCEVHEGAAPSLIGEPMGLSFTPDGRLMAAMYNGIVAITGF